MAKLNTVIKKRRERDFNETLIVATEGLLAFMKKLGGPIQWQCYSEV